MSKKSSNKSRVEKMDTDPVPRGELVLAESDSTENTTPRDMDTPKVVRAALPAAKPKAPVERQVTAMVWARGQADPLVRAFTSEHARKRVVKRGAREWKSLFSEWLRQPRG